MRNQFGSNECFVPPAGSSSSFMIRHFNGDVSYPFTPVFIVSSFKMATHLFQVIYDTYSILNANADTLADDIISIFASKVCACIEHVKVIHYTHMYMYCSSTSGTVFRILLVIL